ncbi:MAG: hypothetical protein JNK93_03715 [Planctomycetia bacterium]|nr:hypothetical protein [Planctomycetia bacterium]
MYVVAGVAFVVCFAVAFWLVQRITGGSKPAEAKAAAPAANTGAPATPPAPNTPNSPAAPASPAPPAPAGNSVVYEPRVSEAKLTEYLKQKGNEVRITEDEVFAIMGKPTRTELYFDGVRKGEKLHIYHAHWEVPGSGVKSQITFANGVTSGMILGLEVSPKK